MTEEARDPVEKEEEGERGVEFLRASHGVARGAASRRQFIQLGLGALALSVAGEAIWVMVKGLEAGAKAPPEPVEVQVGDIPAGGTKEIVYGGDPALVMNLEEGLQVLSLQRGDKIIVGA